MLLFSNPLTDLGEALRPVPRCICGAPDCAGECEELLGLADTGGA